MINKNNYEIWITDYLDGKLTAAQESELMLFMESHPDIQSQMEGLAEMMLTEDDFLTYHNKASLKKPDYNEIKKQIEPLLLAELEGCITEEEKTLLNRSYALYPELKSDAYLFKETILSADLEVIFPEKDKLKKPIPLVIYYSRWIRVAAAILIMGFGFWLLRDFPVKNKQEAHQQKFSAPNDIKESIPDSYANLSNKKSSEPLPKYKMTGGHVSRKSVGKIENKIITLAAVEQIIPRIENYKRIEKNLQDMVFPIPVNTHKEYVAKQQTYLTLTEFFLRGIKTQKEKVLKDPYASSETKFEDIGWAALSIINTVTEADIKVVKKYDENGNKEGLEIVAGGFELNSGK